MKPKILDFAAVMLVLVLAALTALPAVFARGGTYVEITANGESYILLLDGDRTEIITSKNHTLTLTINGGSAFVSEYTCSDGLCAAMGSISSPGETIICLPSEIIIRVSGENSEVYDGIAG